MGVISVPLRLRTAACALLFCVPIAALQTIVVSRSPWWQLPYRTMGIWCLAVALITIPLYAWVTSGRRWSLHLVTIFYAIWALLSAWVAVRMKLPSLGFFTVGLMMYFYCTYSWIRHEMGRSFFDPQLKWYEGLPKPIPGLKCELWDGEIKQDFRVSRLDRDGAFLFHADLSSPWVASRPGKPSELVFTFRERQLRCAGVPVCRLDRGVGAGFRFQALTPDSRKELGDFVEYLRGEGYV